MLVLTRNPGESVLIGNEIEITVNEVRGDEVCLEITAPNTTRPNRKETWRLNEPIPISDNISLMIAGIRGSKVRLGITAPSNVHIARKDR
ncbi:MAG: carbon storage regulator [Planctomycetota bacterium]|jgi:carbon storage regulator CsrA